MGQQMTMIDWMNWLDRGNQPNYFVLGRSGAGKGIHPWDELKSCTCGNNYPFMRSKDGDFCTGFPYSVVCPNCGKHTSEGSVENIKKEWNEMN